MRDMVVHQIYPVVPAYLIFTSLVLQRGSFTTVSLPEQLHNHHLCIHIPKRTLGIANLPVFAFTQPIHFSRLA